MKARAHILAEAALVCGVGLLLGIGANWLSPRGLTLTRDYFPGSLREPLHASPKAAGKQTVPGGVEETRQDPVSARIQGEGLGVIDGDRVLDLFRNPLYQQEFIVFVDARNQEQFQNGHIPGAYLFDHYFPDNDLPTVLPACLSAQKIVVYCTGGECEDSLFAAMMLRDSGVPAENLFVYLGGIREWRERKLAVETGGRLSGVIEGREP